MTDPACESLIGLHGFVLGNLGCFAPQITRINVQNGQAILTARATQNTSLQGTQRAFIV